MDFRQIQVNILFNLINFVILTICALTEQYDYFAKSNFNTDCTEDGLLLIESDVISIADVIKTAECWSEANQINIFALNKVIFDDDIDKRDEHVNIAIFAPTWEIIPPPAAVSTNAMVNQTQRHILLNAAFDFNFYGVCIEKINGHQLQFSIDGDANRIKMINDNSISINESSLLKPTNVLTSDFNVVEILKAYKHYARANFEQSTNHSMLWEFLVELSTQYGLVNLNELIDDFLCLEDKYSDLKKHIDVMPMYQSLRDQLEHLNQQLNGHEGLRNIFHAALIGKILAIRNHTTITELNQLNGIVFLKKKLYRMPENAFIPDHEENQIEPPGRISESVKKLITTTTTFISKMYDETPRNNHFDKDAIVRNQMEFPLKSLQHILWPIVDNGFLYFYNDEYWKSSDEYVKSSLSHNKQLIFSKLFEEFQHKLNLFKEVLQNFVDFLKQEGDNERTSKEHNDTVDRTVTDLLVEVNELLVQSDENRTDNLLNVLCNAWPNLSNVIDDAKSQFESQIDQQTNSSTAPAIEKFGRMQNLMKCFQMGIEIYQDCHNSSTKMMDYVQKIDSTFRKHKFLLENWKEFENGICENIISIFHQRGTAQILPHLRSLNRIFGKMQHHSFSYSSDINRVIQDTNQAIKLTIDLCNFYEARNDRETLEKILKHLPEERQRRVDIDPEVQSKMDILKEIIKSNARLEICFTTALQMRKMSAFPFEQDYYGICDLPTNMNATWNSTNVEEILFENIDKIESGVDYANRLRGDVVSFSDENVILYEWKHKDYHNEIYSLLHEDFGGYEIILNADIANANVRSNAVKFKKVWIEFNFANKTKQDMFYDAISVFYLEMRMTGNHYYRCDNRIYYVPSVNADFSLNYRMEFLRSDLFTQALSEKDAFLSPYTMWKILIKVNYSEFKSKSESKSKSKYKPHLPLWFARDEIDLRLVGNIEYVANEGYGKQICKSDKLDRDYIFDRIVEEP